MQPEGSCGREVVRFDRPATSSTVVRPGAPVRLGEGPISLPEPVPGSLGLIIHPPLPPPRRSSFWPRLRPPLRGRPPSFNGCGRPSTSPGHPHDEPLQLGRLPPLLPLLHRGHAHLVCPVGPACHRESVPRRTTPPIPIFRRSSDARARRKSPRSSPARERSGPGPDGTHAGVRAHHVDCRQYSLRPPFIPCRGPIRLGIHGSPSLPIPMRRRFRLPPQAPEVDPAYRPAHQKALERRGPGRIRTADLRVVSATS